VSITRAGYAPEAPCARVLTSAELNPGAPRLSLASAIDFTPRASARRQGDRSAGDDAEDDW